MKDTSGRSIEHPTFPGNASPGSASTETQPKAGPLRARIGCAQWYARRLMAMSPAEICHRISEQARRRHYRRTEVTFTGLDGMLPAIPGMRERLVMLPEEAVPLAAWEAFYRKTARGEYAALGCDWPPLPDRTERWHSDPVTGKSWPRETYCFDVSYRSASGIGDVKYVWELNRLQHLQPIAAYAARTGNLEADAFCRREIASWIEANPPFLGVNWSSGIELALRVVSLLVVTTILGPKTFGREERQRLLSCLAAHGYWIERFPSRFSSANNHLVAEAGGLFVLGTLASGLPGARAWREYGRDTLEREIVSQIAPDGVGREQSPTYTAFSLEWWLLCDAVARATGEPFSPALTARIRAAGRFLRWILDERDNAPRIGDDDEGRVIFSPQHNDSYVPSVLQAAAGACAAGDVAPNGTYPHLWRTLHPDPPRGDPTPSGVRSFADGGYTVVREPSSQGELLLVFDHGPLGYLSIAAHGHADALALWLHLGGRPVLVDAGTFLYHAGGEWRDHLRGSPAHNTLCIDGHDSSTIAGPFNWSGKASADLLECAHEQGGWRIAAEHDGYRSTFGVRHRRTVEKIDDDSLRIVDRLVGARRAHAVEVGFLLHPSLTVEPGGAEEFLVLADGPPIMKIAATGPLAGCVEKGRLSPPRGWYSARFGALEETNRIVFRGLLPAGEPSTIFFSIFKSVT